MALGFSDVNWMIIASAMVGKFIVNIPGSGTWLYALEVYPTSIRSIGAHTCSIIARIGAIGASYIGILVSNTGEAMRVFVRATQSQRGN